MKALIAGPRLKGIGDPDAGPALLGKMQDALRIGLAEPWCRVELESECIVGGMARSPDHRLPPGSALRSAILTHAPTRTEAMLSPQGLPPELLQPQITPEPGEVIAVHRIVG